MSKNSSNEITFPTIMLIHSPQSAMFDAWPDSP